MTEKSQNNDIEKKVEDSQNNEDEELTALLDSALEDFNTTKKDGVQTSQVSKDDAKRPEPPNSLWNEEFVQQTATRFQQNIQYLFSPGSDGTFSAEQLGENIQRLAEAATQSVGFDASPDTEFSSIIAQTLKNLSEYTENIQNQLTDEDLMNMLGTFGNVTDPNADSNTLLPLMQQMMQNLLSKDILYPALSSMTEKYPQWLEDNKSKISTAEFEKYSEQMKIMKEVCEELDKETPEDSKEVKNARFDKILGLMQKETNGPKVLKQSLQVQVLTMLCDLGFRTIQDCGQPPAELAGDLDPMLQLDEHGNPQLPPNFPSQCSLM